MIHVNRRPMSFGGLGALVRIHDVELKLTNKECEELTEALRGAGYGQDPDDDDEPNSRED
jgi:hypothetical protein